MHTHICLWITANALTVFWDVLWNYRCQYSSWCSNVLSWMFWRNVWQILCRIWVNEHIKSHEWFSTWQRASGVTLVFIELFQTSIFHLSEPTGAQALVHFWSDNRISVPQWLTTGYPGFCYFKIQFMMLPLTSSQAKRGPFLTLWMSSHDGSSSGLIVFGVHTTGVAGNYGLHVQFGRCL